MIGASLPFHVERLSRLPTERSVSRLFLFGRQLRADQSDCLGRVGELAEAIEKVAADGKGLIGETLPLGGVGLREQCGDLAGTFGDHCLDLRGILDREE